MLVDAYFFENGGIKSPYLRISGFTENSCRQSVARDRVPFLVVFCSSYPHQSE